MDDHNPDEVLGTQSDGEFTQVERDRVKKLFEALRQARKFDEPSRKQYARDRRYAAGTADVSWAVATNLIGSFIDILVAYLYAKDPDVSARPVERVEVDPQVRMDAVRAEVLQQVEQEAMLAGQQPDPELVEALIMDRMNQISQEERARKAEQAAFCKTIELVVSRLWRDGRLKRAVRKQVRSALSVGPGWLKCIMQIDKKRDPVVETELNDAQDNLQRIQQLQREFAEQGNLEANSMEEKAVELQEAIDGLEANIEVIARKGLAIDFCRAEDVQVSLDVACLTDYLEADWVANTIYVPKEKIRGMFPRIPEEMCKAATTYYQRQPKEPSSSVDSVADGVGADDAAQFSTGSGSPPGDQQEFAAVTELWDRVDNHIKTLVQGVPVWAREPYTPEFATRRFFPYFLLAFYDVDGQRHPQSVAWRLSKLQDEYNDARSNFRLTRKRAIPGTLFNAEQLDQDNVRRIEQSEQQEFTPVRPTNPQTDINTLFAPKPYATVDPGLFETSPILRDMEKMSGVQESLQQSVAQPKTATEAEIQQSGFAARSSTDRDTLEDMLADLAQYSAELALQAITTQDAQRIAGEAAFWPEGMDIEDIVTMVEVDIEGGTTGKPHTSAEREAWSSALPLVKETQIQVAEFRAMGNEPMAAALTETLRETLLRLDDRVDPDRFIPQVPAMVPIGPMGGASAGPNGAPLPDEELPPDVVTPGVQERLEQTA